MKSQTSGVSQYYPLYYPMKQPASSSWQSKLRKQPPKNKAPHQLFASVAGCLPDEPSEEGVRLSRTGNSNLTTWIGETKNPASHDENWRGHFFAMMLETGAQGVCEERRSPYLIRWVTNRIRCIFINTVLKAAKNFQFVNFFTSRFPNKKPAPAEAGACIFLLFSILKQC